MESVEREYIFTRQVELITDTETGEVYQIYEDAGVGFITDKAGCVGVLSDLTGYKAEIEALKEEVEVRRPYSLWKDGSKYYLHAIAHNITDGEKYAVYQQLYGSHRYFARKLENFIEDIDPSRVDENTTGQKKRFEIYR